MANVIRPTGLSPVKTVSGASYNAKANLYFIPSSDSNAYYIGDAVKSAANADAFGNPAVTKAAAGDTLRGVIVGILPVAPSVSLVGTPLSLELFSIPASKAKGYYVMVDDDPETVFAIQDDGAGALTGTASNKNANIVVAAPTSPQQLSATTLGTASVATTSTLQLRIMGLQVMPNNAFGVNATWLVKINNHELGGPTAGV